MTHAFSPQAAVQKLTSEAVKLNLVPIHTEYDDFYTIWYVPKQQHFRVYIEVSVWGGRGHESYKEKLDGSTLLARFEEIQTTGTVVAFY